MGTARSSYFHTIQWPEEGALEVWEVEHGEWTATPLAVAENHVPNRIGDFTGDGGLEVLWGPRGRANTWIVTDLEAAPGEGAPLLEADMRVCLFSSFYKWAILMAMGRWICSQRSNTTSLKGPRACSYGEANQRVVWRDGAV